MVLFQLAWKAHLVTHRIGEWEVCVLILSKVFIIVNLDSLFIKKDNLLINNSFLFRNIQVQIGILEGAWCKIIKSSNQVWTFHDIYGHLETKCNQSCFFFFFFGVFSLSNLFVKKTNELVGWEELIKPHQKIDINWIALKIVMSVIQCFLWILILMYEVIQCFMT